MRWGKVMFAAGIVLPSLLGASGCVFIPGGRNQFKQEQQAQIVVGETTRRTAIDLLGEPDLLEDERFLVFDEYRSRGSLWFILAAGNSGAIFSTELETRRFLLLLEFDEQDVLTRFEFERAFVGGINAVQIIPDQHSTVDFPWERKREYGGSARAPRLDGLQPYGLGAVYFPPGVEVPRAAGSQLSAKGLLLGLGSNMVWVWVMDFDIGDVRFVKTGSFHDVAFSPDLTRVTMMGQNVTILDLTHGTTLGVFKGHDSSWWTGKWATCLAFDPASRQVASGDLAGRVFIWDSLTATEVRRLSGPPRASISGVCRMRRCAPA